VDVGRAQIVVVVMVVVAMRVVVMSVMVPVIVAMPVPMVVVRTEQPSAGEIYQQSVKRRSKGTPDRRRRGTPFSDNMMLVC
jgi:hypothetical protein